MRKETKWTPCLLRASRLLEVCAYSYNSKIQSKVWLKHHLFVHSLLPQAHLSTYLAEAGCGARCWGGRHGDNQLKSGARCPVWTKQCSSQEWGSTRKPCAMSDQSTHERCRQFAVVEELGAWGGITSLERQARSLLTSKSMTGKWNLLQKQWSSPFWGKWGVLVIFTHKRLPLLQIWKNKENTTYYKWRLFFS